MLENSKICPNDTDIPADLSTYLWMLRYAVVLVQPVDNASNIIDASKRPKADPPYSSLTLIPDGIKLKNI